jgi:cobalt-zinc-cadmium efflux system protein
VREVHDLHVWTVTSGMVAMSGHAVVPALESHPQVLERIRRAVSELGVGHVTIQLETGCDGACADTVVAGAAGHPHPH